MKASLLSVDRVEFLSVSVEANPNFDSGSSKVLQQLEFSFKGAKFIRKVHLGYPDDSASDPRYFSFSLNLLLVGDKQSDGIVLPYDVDVQAVAYMHYKADNHEGMERFRAVRATGYSILYGAIREMVSNVTARGPHGMWMLPGADFNSAAAEEAVNDEAERVKRVGELSASEESLVGEMVCASGDVKKSSIKKAKKARNKNPDSESG